MGDQAAAEASWVRTVESLSEDTENKERPTGRLSSPLVPRQGHDDRPKGNLAESAGVLTSSRTDGLQSSVWPQPAAEPSADRIKVRLISPSFSAIFKCCKARSLRLASMRYTVRLRRTLFRCLQFRLNSLKSVIYPVLRLVFDRIDVTSSCRIAKLAPCDTLFTV